nr:MAG TPA: hypothetical protein [Caudoviricetes sp.]
MVHGLTGPCRCKGQRGLFPFREDMTGKNDSEPRRRGRQTRIGEV